MSSTVGFAIGTIAAAVLAAAGIGLGAPRVPDTSGFHLGLDELRRLAEAPIDELPERVEVMEAASSTKLLALAIGEPTLDRIEMPWTSFRIVYPARTIVVDVPPAEPGARASRLGAAVRDADIVLFTHEHPDHIGGLASLTGEPGATDRLVLNDAQASASGVRATGARMLSSTSAARIGPGVSVRPAPGHTPGSQLVYVSTRSGREYLLIGDVAWHRIHFEEPRAHPRVSGWFLGEDPVAIGHQLRAIHAAWSSDRIVVVPSHDGAYLRELAARELLASGFE
jgi:glyoxylase-like metal-dependent hydrolase (beta-lactamase superfamily II)